MISQETAVLLSGLIFAVIAVSASLLSRKIKSADELEPFAVVTHDPEPAAEDLGIPAFLRHQDEDDELIEEWETRLPRPRKERE